MGQNPPHLWHFFFTNQATQALKGLRPGHRLAVFRNLRQLVNTEAPFELAFVEKLQGERFTSSRRFRVGTYRIIFTIDSRPVTHEKTQYKGTIVILAIDHRKDIYRP